jgi:L-ribulokinase
VVAGGLIKNTFLMQLYCDIINLPLSVLESEQGPALGSAIHAAVAAGAYPSVNAAAEKMGRVSKALYKPNVERAKQYDRLYAEYEILHDYFGRGTNDVMRRLKALKREASDAAN